MKIKSVSIAILYLLLGCQCFSQSPMKISGQQGDERFFPLLSAIYGQMKINVTYEILPSSRALSSVNSGAHQAEVGRIQEISETYSNIRYSREPLLTVDLMVLVKKGSSQKLSAIVDLKNLRVGYVIGMSVAEYFAKKATLDALPVATHEQLAQMLDSDRIDVALMGTAFRDSPVFKVGLEALKIATFSVFHIFNKEYEALIPKFDMILSQLKKSGEYAKLLPPVNN